MVGRSSPKQPEIKAPPPPAPPPPAPSRSDIDTEALADAQRRRSFRRGGRNSTALTGGLGAATASAASQFLGGSV